MAQCLKTLAALAEDPNSVPSTMLCCMQLCRIQHPNYTSSVRHTNVAYKHTHKNNKMLKRNFNVGSSETHFEILAKVTFTEFSLIILG